MMYFENKDSDNGKGVEQKKTRNEAKVLLEEG